MILERLRLHKQPKEDMRVEMARRKSQRQRILELLQADKPVYTYDLQRIAYNYTMRVSDLRKEGHKIPAPEYVRPGVYRYHYAGRSHV